MVTRTAVETAALKAARKTADNLERSDTKVSIQFPEAIAATE